MNDVGNLLGKEISSVAFARNHVEFHFDGAILRSIADPSIAIGNVTYRFPKAGSRDALCLVIGATVEALSLIDGKHLEFTTSNGCRVWIPLADGSPEQSEALQFTTG